MKKALPLLMVLLSLLLLIGCNQSETAAKSSVNFYYRTAEVAFGTESGVIIPENREINTDDIQLILKQYLEGPKSEKLISPFPENLTIRGFNYGPARTSLTLSTHIADIKDSELTIACACIAKTVFELTDTRSLEIKSDSGLIGGSQSIILMCNDLILYDDYFASSDATS